MSLSSIIKTTLVALTLQTTVLSTAVQAIEIDTPSDQMKATADQMRAMADIIRAQADYQRALAEAQLTRAKADFTEAQAMGEFQKARERALLVNRLEVQLKRVLKEESQLRQKAEKIEENIVTASTILAGKVTVHSLRSMGYLEIHAFEPARVLAVMSQKIDLSIVNELDSADEPFTGENLGQLINYIRTKSLKVEPWGRVHQVIAQSLVDLSEGATAKLAKIKDDIQVLRDTKMGTGLPLDPIQ